VRCSAIMSNPNGSPAPAPAVGYDRRLGTFDATMVVVGAIVGAGIFLNPAIVAQRVGTTGMVLAAWALGGAIAVVGALCFAELGARLPRAGGGYVYLRDAFGPLPAFLYGWTQLLVINTGGIAAVAITFASYAADVGGLGEAWIKPLAVAAIVLLSGVNAAGVRFGSWVQNAFTLLKLAALALLVGVGAWMWLQGPGAAAAGTSPGAGGGGVLAMGTALVAVLFAYGGWQHANNIAEEIREPERRLPVALLVGVAIVVTVYVCANAAYLAALGPAGLAASSAPAADALRAAVGRWGGVVISVGVACSTFGILNIFILAAPRIYQAMAADGAFFTAVARLSPRTRTPAVGIWIQMVWAVLLALSGTYGQLLDYVVFGDWIFFGGIVATLFAFRARDRAGLAGAPPRFRVPAHPLLPGLFVAAAAFVVYSSVVSNPHNALWGTLLIVAGVPAYVAWRRAAGRRLG
jgi:APA family basic amino acid/polyamine antiporter